MLTTKPSGTGVSINTEQHRILWYSTSTDRNGQAYTGDPDESGAVADCHFSRKRGPLELEQDGAHGKKGHHPQEGEGVHARQRGDVPLGAAKNMASAVAMPRVNTNQRK